MSTENLQTGHELDKQDTKRPKGLNHNPDSKGS